MNKLNQVRRGSAPAGLLAILILTAGTAPVAGQGNNQILSLSPASAAQGASGLTVLFTLDTDIPPPPPVGIAPSSVTLGSISGTSLSHPTSNTVTAVFSIPADETLGAKDAVILFPPSLLFSKASAFTVTAGPGVLAGFSGTPTSGIVPLTVVFTDASTGTISGRVWSFGDGGTSEALHPSHTYTNTGCFTVSLTVWGANGSNTVAKASYITVTAEPMIGGYTVVDTGQTRCYNGLAEIAAPALGQPYYGQDAQCAGVPPSYSLSADGKTVYDNRTGLTWQRSPDTSGDGAITATDKLTWAQAQAWPAALNAAHHGGYSDWRLPTIKELYSLIDFRGTDPSGLTGTDTTGLVPFIDTNTFQFAYGDTSAGERVIDSQYASCTLYVSTVDESLLFGVNFADGRIKGYGLTLMGSEKTFLVQCVRGNTSYGLNLFVDNGDQTVSDRGAGLMWTKGDSGSGLNWSNALAWVQARNASNHLGHSDWRLPNVKELQSIVDYTRSPDTTASAAIDPVLSCTVITNENNKVDYPWYWSGTTHAQYNGSGAGGSYVCFGRGLGYMDGVWRDIHGAGCQRSDPKSGNLASYAFAVNGYYNTNAPQGDAIRIFNHVRLVRDYPATTDSVGDGIPDWWRTQWFGGSGMTTNSESCASRDGDGDGMSNLEEYGADTNPTTNTSRLAILGIQPVTNGILLEWVGGSNAWQRLESCSDMVSNQWSGILTNTPPTRSTNSAVVDVQPATNAAYRVKAWR